MPSNVKLEDPANVEELLYWTCPWEPPGVPLILIVAIPAATVIVDIPAPLKSNNVAPVPTVPPEVLIPTPTEETVLPPILNDVAWIWPAEVIVTPVPTVTVSVDPFKVILPVPIVRIPVTLAFPLTTKVSEKVVAIPTWSLVAVSIPLTLRLVIKVSSGGLIEISTIPFPLSLKVLPLPIKFNVEKVAPIETPPDWIPIELTPLLIALNETMSITSPETAAVVSPTVVAVSSEKSPGDNLIPLT